MNFKTISVEHEGKIFRIEEDFPDVGAYLYIYEKNKCIYDFLQNNVEDCIEFALEKFKLPVHLWEKTFDNSSNLK